MADQGVVPAILSEIDPGSPARRCRAEDLEGHRRMFMARG